MQNEMSELQQIEISLEEANKAVELRDALIKLEKSYVFKKVILREFMEEEAKLMAPLIGSPNEAAAKGATNVCIGIGALGSFLNKVHRQGDVAERAIQQLENAKIGLVDEE